MCEHELNRFVVRWVGTQIKSFIHKHRITHTSKNLTWMANIVYSVGETSHNVVCICVSVCIGGQRETVTCSLCLSMMVSWRFEVEKLNQIFLHFTVMSVMGEQVIQIVKAFVKFICNYIKSGQIWFCSNILLSYPALKGLKKTFESLPVLCHMRIRFYKRII